MLSNIWKHFKTITYHKYLVLKGCFRVGLYWQGIVHDLSKYSLTEFCVGVRYYQGNRSPNNKEREIYGFSKAWLHHKGRNKHHYEYWIDYSVKGSRQGMIPTPMPKKYVVEMLIDRVSASKVYNKGAYTNQDALLYYKNGIESMPHIMHEETRTDLEALLTMLAEKGELETFSYIKKVFLKKNEAYL